MTTLKVPEIHCEMCTARIKKAMKEAGIACEVDQTKKTVTIDGAKKKEAIDILDDLGFSAEE